MCPRAKFSSSPSRMHQIGISQHPHWLLFSITNIFISRQANKLAFFTLAAQKEVNYASTANERYNVDTCRSSLLLTYFCYMVLYYIFVFIQYQYFCNQLSFKTSSLYGSISVASLSQIYFNEVYITELTILQENLLLASSLQEIFLFKK